MPKQQRIFPWQQTQWDYLSQRQQKNNLPHALLLTGPQGMGKFVFANLFVKQLLCLTPTTAQIACGECRTCLLFQAGSHPDFYTVQPEAEGKNIRVDQIRELIGQLNQTTIQGGYRIAVVNPADAMNAAAANALLKTLEEPGDKIVILLVTSRPNIIPATIRSRCQSVVFPLPPSEVAKQWLKQELPAAADHALLLALAEGAPLRAVALTQDEHLQQRQELLADLKTLSMGRGDPIQITTGWLKTNTQSILQCLITLVIDVIRLKSGLPLATIVNQDNPDFLQKLAQTNKPRSWFNYLDELYKLRQQQTISNSLNQQLFLENLFCLWNEYGKIKT